MPNPQMKILSIDGGGIKGIIPCTILKAIENKTGSSISELFDLIAGTSTGGIIALGLSKPAIDQSNDYSAEDMLNLYVNQGKQIFTKRGEDFWSKLGTLFDKTKVITTNNYKVENFEKLLDEKFGNTFLNKSLVPLLITTYDISTGRPFYFSTRLASEEGKENFLMSAIARSTSAAPTFFEPSLIKYDKDNDVAFVDGGVFANNPSILAYCEAKEIWKSKSHKNVQSVEHAKSYNPKVMADNSDYPFYMLSLGCGHSSSLIDFSDAKKWRALNWIQPLLTDIFMRSVEESTHYTMQHLMPAYGDGSPRYQRLDLQLPEDCTEMDNASESNIAKLVDIAEEYVKVNGKAIDDICKILK